MAKEKRKHPRIQIDQMIEISFGRETFMHGQGINISKSGILCRCEQPVDHNSTIFFMINIGSDEEPKHVTCEGMVVRCDEQDEGYDIGIAFSHIDDEEAFLEFFNF